MANAAQLRPTKTRLPTHPSAPNMLQAVQSQSKWSPWPRPLEDKMDHKVAVNGDKMARGPQMEE